MLIPPKLFYLHLSIGAVAILASCTPNSDNIHNGAIIHSQDTQIKKIRYRKSGHRELTTLPVTSLTNKYHFVFQPQFNQPEEHTIRIYKGEWNFSNIQFWFGFNYHDFYVAADDGHWIVCELSGGYESILKETFETIAAHVYSKSNSKRWEQKFYEMDH